MCYYSSFLFLSILFHNIKISWSLSSDDDILPDKCPDGSVIDPDNPKSCYYFIEEQNIFDDANYYVPTSELYLLEL